MLDGDDRSVPAEVLLKIFFDKMTVQLEYFDRSVPRSVLPHSRALQKLQSFPCHFIFL